MDPVLGSGDSPISQRYEPESPRLESKYDTTPGKRLDENSAESDENDVLKLEKITPQAVEDHENNLKDRIAQCRNIIESLKFELNEEKAKLEKDTSSENPQTEDHFSNWDVAGFNSGSYNVSTSNDVLSEFPLNTDMYSACVDNKLNCDENLMEYEKQLEKYQTTLNRAQVEKKNAIRKQMLAKAYKLKLLELENQCNIELLRVKQSLQCLEPLQMIASKWKTSSDEEYNLDKFELMPCYPEISMTSGVEVEAVKDNPIDSGSFDVNDNDVSISE